MITTQPDISLLYLTTPKVCTEVFYPMYEQW